MRIVEEQEFAEIPGQDAFLDVLTNMVGIIILLVVVMGLRSSRAASTALARQDPELAAAAMRGAAENDLRMSYRKAAATQSEIRQLVKQVVNIRREALFREQERNELSTYVAAFEQELNQRRAGLSADQQRDFDLRRQLTEAGRALDDLTREQVALLSQPTETEILESQPTPIVRRHEGKELFLQLSQGHVAVIPLADLMEECKQHLAENAWRLKDVKRLSGTVGPIDGFKLRYLVRKREIVGQSPSGYLHRGTGIEAVQWELLPVVTPLGEPIDQAVLGSSELFQRLKDFAPDSTVIAIGVYPDSLRELHQLKRSLREGGYRVAEQLIPEGKPIGFSPHGQSVYAQ